MVNEGPWAVEDFVKGMETALTVLRLPARPAAVSQSASFAELESMAAARVLSGEEGEGKEICLVICSQAYFDAAHVIAISLLVQVAVLSHQSNNLYKTSFATSHFTRSSPVHPRHYNFIQYENKYKNKTKEFARGFGTFLRKVFMRPHELLASLTRFFQNHLATLPV